MSTTTMATFSDGVDATTTDDMRFYLQNLLDGKEKQLQQAGTLGQQLLEQRMELEERIRQLQELDLDVSSDNGDDATVREKYRELAETIKAWDTENEALSTTFITRVCCVSCQNDSELLTCSLFTFSIACSE